MQDSRYLGNLGRLADHCRLVLLDLRGTGESAEPEDPATYRCDRLVDDVEALRLHLGLERLDLLAHSAGTNLAELYAQGHPDRVGRMVLVTPSTMAVGLSVTPETRVRTAELRSHEPWFQPAFGALQALLAGEDVADGREAIAPFWYGRWDEAARAHRAAESAQINGAAAALFAADGAFDPEGTRRALGGLDRPVLLVAGQLDLNSPPSAVAEHAGLFPSGRLAVIPGASHFPWLDDPRPFVETVAAFLS
jgi:pimeloyl-ACP methyl ester carboxylesterase